MTIGEHDAKIANAPLMFSITFSIQVASPSSSEKLTSVKSRRYRGRARCGLFRIHLKDITRRLATPLYRFWRTLTPGPYFGGLPSVSIGRESLDVKMIRLPSSKGV